jgi:hypothetical protein
MTATIEAPAERARRDPEPHSCQCGRQWAGGRPAHCAGCHRTFSSDSAFDLHLIAPPQFGPPPFETCRDPASLTKGDGTPRLEMVVARFGPVWSWPGTRPDLAASGGAENA